MGILSSVITNPVVAVIATVLDRIIPDKNAKEKAMMELKLMELNGELDIAGRQIEVNMQEAQHPSVYVAGWRPFVGWVCAGALALFAIQRLVVAPLIAILPLFGVDPGTAKAVSDILLEIDLGPFMSVLFGMLGLGMGALRSFDKVKGIDSKFN